MSIKFEDTVRAYEEAKRTFEVDLRKWRSDQEPRPVTKEDWEGLERRYILEHPEQSTALEALVTEVNVARAELERRWIEAHEDLALLRHAGQSLALSERARGAND